MFSFNEVRTEGISSVASSEADRWHELIYSLMVDVASNENIQGVHIFKEVESSSWT